MKIVVAARCRNEIQFVHRFLHGYDFADYIVLSDGGSTDGTVEELRRLNNPKVILHHFDIEETVNGVTWNPDAPHMNFVIDKAKELDPDWLIFDDFDDVPNYVLKNKARDLLWTVEFSQVNAFRLYMWGDTQYFPKMNNYFDSLYTSLWAWRPDKQDIHADPQKHHGTLVGTNDDAAYKINLPMCLLHKSWHPDTIEKKLKRQNAVGIQIHHPFIFAGELESLPEWATECE